MNLWQVIIEDVKPCYSQNTDLRWWPQTQAKLKSFLSRELTLIPLKESWLGSSLANGGNTNGFTFTYTSREKGGNYWRNRFDLWITESTRKNWPFAAQVIGRKHHNTLPLQSQASSDSMVVKDFHQCPVPCRWAFETVGSQALLPGRGCKFQCLDSQP